MSPPPQTWPFGGLLPFGYDAIIADPPWLFSLRSEKGEEKSPQAKYKCLPTPEICALPVGNLARSNCILMLWATFPMLPDAFKVMEAWGFRYVTGGAWNKQRMGTGYWLRSQVELFLIGFVGRPVIRDRGIRNFIDEMRREHSRKPEAQYEIIERLFPDGYYAELFSRADRDGWATWGLEAGKFEAAK